MKRLIGNLLVIALLVAVVSFFAAPALAFFAIRSAAQAGDVAGLSQLIDFTATRQSLRPQLSARPQAMAPAPTFLENPIGAVRRQFQDAVAPAGPDPDAYLTPAALSALTAGEGRYAAERSRGTGPVAAAAEGAPLPRPVYWGMNRARLAVTDEGGSDTVFTFERRGPFEWKLVHIGLPDGATPVPSAPAAPQRPAAR